jgi:hypothetical protein
MECNWQIQQALNGVKLAETNSVEWSETDRFNDRWLEYNVLLVIPRNLQTKFLTFRKRGNFLSRYNLTYLERGILLSRYNLTYLERGILLSRYNLTYLDRGILLSRYNLTYRERGILLSY